MTSSPQLTGWQKICRDFGHVKLGEVMMVWDWAIDSAIPESKMRFGSARWKKSERAKFKMFQKTK